MRARVICTLGLTLGVGLAGCVLGAPPGFSEGTTWTMALVDPLEEGRLVVPVMVNGKGPFLFMLDPDAPFTTADQALAGIVGIPATGGPRLSDEHDTTHPTWYAPIPSIKIGNLEVTMLTLGLVENNRYNTDGRRIWGVIGRDVIADSLVFTIDRDRGQARLTVNNKFAPPPNAQVIAYKKLAPRNGPENSPGLVATTRYLVRADVDGKQVDLHLDLGDVPSQLLASHWDDAKLQSTEWTMDLVDEAGTHREVTRDGIAARVTVPGKAAPITREGIGFVPFEDRRWLSGQIDGTLGLDFFRPYVVSADWYHQLFYVQPRETGPAVAAERLARWGTGLTVRCAAAGCATASAASAAGAEATAGGDAIFHLQRDPAMTGHNLELVMSATSADGRPLPPVYVDLDALTSTFDAPIEPRYAGAQFAVLDLSPFPRACPNHAPSCMHLAPPVAP